MEKKIQVKYNQSLLDETLKIDEATLVGEYDKINSSTRINFICKCGKENNKTFTKAYLQVEVHVIFLLKKQKRSYMKRLIIF